MRALTRVLAITGFLALLIASPLLAAPAGQVYGKGVTLKQSTPVSALLEKPDGLVGKTVAVTGMIVDVCDTRGCWLELAGEKPYQKLLVKVEDGVIVFPLTAKGKTATVQGVLAVQEGCGIGPGVEGEPFPGFQPAADSGCGNCPSAKKKTVKEYEIQATGAVIK